MTSISAQQVCDIYETFRVGCGSDKRSNKRRGKSLICFEHPMLDFIAVWIDFDDADVYIGRCAISLVGPNWSVTVDDIFGKNIRREGKLVSILGDGDAAISSITLAMMLK
jgi:hypothetical protein